MSQFFFNVYQFQSKSKSFLRVTQRGALKNAVHCIGGLALVF